MSSNTKHRIIKIAAWTAGIIIAIPLIIATLLYIPPVQKWATDLAFRKVSDATGMRISVGEILLKFPLNLRVGDVTVIEASGDTMVTASTAEVRVAFMPLLKGEIAIGGVRADTVFYQMGNRDSVMWLRANVAMADIDRGEMNFKRGLIDIGRAKVSGARVMLAMKDTVTPAKPDTAAAAPLTIKATSIDLEDIDYVMVMPPVIDSLKARIGAARLRDGLVDTGARRINAGSLSVDGVMARYLTPPPASAKDKPEAGATADSLPATPPADDSMWVITADSISLTAPYALYAVSGAKPLPGLDFNYLEVRDTRILVTDFRNRGTEIRVPLNTLRTTERCGVTLNASGTFSMDSTLMTAAGFNILTDYSRLKLDAAMGMGDLASDPTLPLRLMLEGSVSANDAARLFPLAAPMVATLPSPRDMVIAVDADGTPSRVDLKKMSVTVPGVMRLSARGSVSDIMDFNKIGGKMTIDGAVTGPAAVRRSLTVMKVDTSIHIPALTLKGTVDYHPGNIDGRINLKADGGSVLADGRWNARREGYNAIVKLDRFPAGAFMPALGIGRVTGTVSADGRGYNPFSTRTSLHAEADIENAEYHGRTYSDALLKADLHDGQATGQLLSGNPGANLGLDFSAAIDSGVVNGRFSGDIRDLDLHALGLMTSPCGGSLTLDGTASYNPANHDIKADVAISDLYWVMDTTRYMTPSLNLTAAATTSQTSLGIINEDLKGDMVVYAPIDSIMTRIDRLTAAVQHQMNDKRADIAAIQRILPPMDAAITMGHDNLASRLLADNGIAAAHTTLRLRNDSLIHLSAFADGINFSGTPIDSINLQVNQHGKYLVYSAGMKNGPGKLAEWADVTLRGFLADDKLGAFLNQHNPQGEQGYRLGLIASMADSVATVRFMPYDPTIAYRKWSLNEGNFLSYNIYNKKIDADLTLTGGPSSLRLFTRPLTDAPDGASEKELVVEAKAIEISDWIALSPFAPPMAGTLSANLKLHRLNGDLVGTAVVGLDDFTYNRQRVGSFGVDLKVANNPKSKSLWADGIVWVNGQKTMTLSGALNDSTQTSPFLLDFSMIRFPLEVANPFLPPGVATLSGMLNGTMKISGAGTAPIFNGYLQFDSAAVKVAMLGSRYSFSDEKIPVDSNIVRFNDFPINTLNENPLRINGTADISNLSDVKFDIALEGNDMLMVNSNRPHGADIYGKGYMSIDATAKGDMTGLICNATVALLSGSNVTYVMSESTSASLTSRSTGDMVRFVSFADSLQVSKEDPAAKAMNLILDANLNIEPNTTVNVDLSADGKNRVQIQGIGELGFNMTPQNNGRLVGRFTIEDGFVRYTPPLMGEKHFKFESGSFVNFTGDMLNPTLNIKAVDALKANVTPEGGNSRLVNFDIILSITGTVNNMNVAFDLTTDDDITIQNELSAMSADQRANQAMNLLLYNTYTGPGTKASANLSGNPLYSFLASQLNSFAANYVKGVDLSFGIDQYDKTRDGASSTATTYSYQMSKSFLNNRIRIVVGGNYTTDANADENFAENLINDISFEYLLNRSGSMYVRVFRHTGYESILEGEITATGVGFVYKRNLTSLRDMFRFGRKGKKTTTQPSPSPADSTTVRK